MTREGDAIVLRPARAGKRLAARLGDDEPVALLTDLEPGADAHLTWRAGQTAPEAVAPDGSAAARVAGAFLLVVPAQAANRGSLVEDGFALSLGAGALGAVRRALQREEPFTLDSAGLRFELRPALAGA